MWPSTACIAVRTMSSRPRERNCCAACSMPRSDASILTMQTPSIWTGTPCVVYVSAVLTSNCMSSRERRWTRSRNGGREGAALDPLADGGTEGAATTHDPVPLRGPIAAPARAPAGDDEHLVGTDLRVLMGPDPEGAEQQAADPRPGDDERGQHQA